MQIKKIFFGAIITIFIFSLIIPFTRSKTEEKLFYSTKDAFSHESAPNQNFGKSTLMYCGIHYNCKCNVFIGFDISSVSQGWSEVKLYLNFRDIREESNFILAVCENNWNEYELTHINKPTISGRTRSWTISLGGLHCISIGDLINARLSELSLCIYTFDNQGKYAIIVAREYAISEQAPRLVFIYPEIYPILIFVIGAIISLACITVIVLNRRKKRSRIPKQLNINKITPSKPIREYKMKTIQLEKELTLAKFCPMCGSRIDRDARFCHECGFKLDR
jgi:hypothetical protein